MRERSEPTVWKFKHERGRENKEQQTHSDTYIQSSNKWVYSPAPAGDSVECSQETLEYK